MQSIFTDVYKRQYLQGAGEMKNIGTYAAKCGKKALVLISQGGYRRIGAMIEESFAGSDCDVVFDYFNGECCESEINRLVAIVKEKGCDLVIGVGGGKIFDTAKAVAYYAETPVFICPTIASTDAPCSACLLYTSVRVRNAEPANRTIDFTYVEKETETE